MDMTLKKKSKKAIGSFQNDDVQNERSLGTNLSQLNENENGCKFNN